ncbi:MAG TPA: ATP-binding protein [Gemmataceae bacterium]|nr:ATP-binding protein [Gemmataceae bacterium]
MTSSVREKSGPQAPEDERAIILREGLDALLEMTGASGGWMSLAGPGGGLSVPLRRGAVSEMWFALQDGRLPVWGFEVREGPTLLNDLPAFPFFGEPPLRNLLSCPLARDGAVLGQVVLANKSTGFTSHDAIIVQASAHILAKVLLRKPSTRPSEIPTAWLKFCLDNAKEGILVFDDAGTLVFANRVWSEWTGYPQEELCNRPAPFPFWLSHGDLMALDGPRPVLSQPAASILPERYGLDVPTPKLGYLPFRHRDHRLFWCQAETVAQEFDGRRVTIGLMRRLPRHGASAIDAQGSAVSFQALAEALPCAVALTDRDGVVIWANDAYIREIVSAAQPVGQSLQSHFITSSAVAAERLLRSARAADDLNQGQLLLQRLDHAGTLHHLLTYWQKVALPGGPGFLFALAEDWETLWYPGMKHPPPNHLADCPEADWLILLLRPNGAIDFWDERWERLTGLSSKDLAGASNAMILDWLFPRQLDREFVSDLLQQPAQRGVQTILEVAGRDKSTALCCTFLPVKGSDTKNWLPALGTRGRDQPGAGQPSSGPAEDAWLLLACEPQESIGKEQTIRTYLRQFTRGLSHLLNNYLTVPVGLAEMALDRSDLPPGLAQCFTRIIESCMRAGRLITSLQDLSIDSAGEKQRLSLAVAVQESVEEFVKGDPEPACTLTVDVRSPEALVEVNVRMLRVVLRHLLTNAAQAVFQQDERRIDVRVHADDAEVHCEIQDSGEGLAVSDWTAFFTPFYSTKGPFARDSAHATLDAAGLGLAVSQHLVALHGGRLELRTNNDRGATAILDLPRWVKQSGSDATRAVAHDKRSADMPVEVPGVQSRGG